MITTRDKEIISWVADVVGVATSSQIERMFFTNKKNNALLARRRLKIIADEGLLKRVQPERYGSYIYYVGKQPSLTDHQLLVTETYVQLANLNKGEITEWNLKADFNGVRPDAFVEITSGSWHYIFCVEVQRLTGNPVDQQKYNSLYDGKSWTKMWPQFPKVLVITDKKVKLEASKVRFIIIPTSFKGIENIF